MKCRQCGAEIAEKAIVCYRCGMGTTEPVRKAVAVKPARSPVVPGIIVVVLVALAVFLWRYASTTANPEYVEFAAGLTLGAAVVILVRTILRR